MDYEINANIKQTLYYGIVENDDSRSFTNKKVYLKYLYILASDHLDNPKVADSIRFRIQLIFKYIVLHLNDMLDAYSITEMLYLISLLSRDGRIVTGYRILDHQERIANKQKFINILKEVFNKNIINDVDFMRYLVKKNYREVLVDYLKFFAPRFDKVKVVLDMYSTSNIPITNILNIYFNNIVINQV